MDDLAPTIVRQPLIIEGYFDVEVDQSAIADFLSELPATLDLRPYGEPTIFSPGGQGRDENQGFDAFIPLIDSGISLYIWSEHKFLSVIVFRCKIFDVDRAVEKTREYFAMSEIVHERF